ncbi:hypothetical protein [Paucibacter sp. XJ19-41]|uniref:hypothetical protein n=1 Tax=Paucibacter sp. XJ19-41 TaxID=2927824 RepID=UPI00234BF244|nr:hypothetical protein [Paucibacter sp. XJ19-41]MDC6171138.1 hypothetical protein [Paucibacter sp. XJ19-41]
MPVAVAVTLYLGVLLYAALMYLLGPLVPVATIALGFGLLVIPYLMLEWIATPAVAAFMGFQARWSVAVALVIGLPLVALFTVITPVVSSGSESLAVPVPWLAVFAKSKSSVMAVVRERLVWWGTLYLSAVVAGRLSLHVRPLQGPDTSQRK